MILIFVIAKSSEQKENTYFSNLLSDLLFRFFVDLFTISEQKSWLSNSLLYCTAIIEMFYKTGVMLVIKLFEGYISQVYYIIKYFIRINSTQYVYFLNTLIIIKYSLSAQIFLKFHQKHLELVKRNSVGILTWKSKWSIEKSPWQSTPKVSRFFYNKFKFNHIVCNRMKSFTCWWLWLQYGLMYIPWLNLKKRFKFNYNSVSGGKRNGMSVCSRV